MTRLSQWDLEATLGFLREANAVTGPDPFPSELLDLLRELVPCDAASYCELDRVQEQILFGDGCAEWRQAVAGRSTGASPEEDEFVFWSVIGESPIYAYHAQTGDFAASKLSDFMSQRSLRGLEVYRQFFRPNEIEHRMVVGLPGPLSHTKCFLLDRGRGRDFGERDRIVLDRLRPHLIALHAAAGQRRRAAALALGGETGGLVVLDASNRIDFATPLAVRLLARYFGGGGGGELPDPVRDWLPDGTQRRSAFPPRSRPPLSVNRNGRRLTICQVARTLLLEEEITTLTDREREIVHELGEGRSNAEIAEQLTIAPTTVRKHLENIYAKLGVRNRTAAVAAARLEVDRHEAER